jgi:hypothetical protein
LGVAGGWMFCGKGIIGNFCTSKSGRIEKCSFTRVGLSNQSYLYHIIKTKTGDAYL